MIWIQIAQFPHREREKWQRTSRVYREWGTCVSMRLDCSDGRPVFFPKRRPAVSLLVVVVSVWRGVIRRLRPSTFNYLPPPPLLRRSGNLSSLICQSSLVRRHCGSNATNRPIQKRPDASQVDWRDKRNQFWPVDNISKLKQKRKETFFHLSWFASTMFLLLFWNNTYVNFVFQVSLIGLGVETGEDFWRMVGLFLLTYGFQKE